MSMHFYNLIKELSKDEKLVIFVDMDGVIASYDFGKPLNFKDKRPLKTNINALEKVSSLDNVQINILSICREDYQIEEKYQWLDKYVSFIKKDNRYIISKEQIPNISSANLKAEFLKNYKTKYRIILIDDDNKVLSTIADKMDNITLFQDSELID